jgi:hypothetical protein
MSRGPGRVQQRILELLARPHVRECSYRDLAEAIYGCQWLDRSDGELDGELAYSASQSECESVGRACRSLERKGMVKVATRDVQDKQLRSAMMSGGMPVFVGPDYNGKTWAYEPPHVMAPRSRNESVVTLISRPAGAGARGRASER